MLDMETTATQEAAMQTAEQATWTKLRSGAWGARGDADALTVGEQVEITTRAGKVTVATVERVVWTDGRTAIAALQERARTRRNNGTGHGRGRGRCVECDAWGPIGQQCRECYEGIHG